MINKENVNSLENRIKSIQSNQNMFLTFIPTKEEYNKYYSKFNLFDFFDQNKKCDTDFALQRFDSFASSFESKNIEYFVLRDYESAAKYGLYDYRKPLKK